MISKEQQIAGMLLRLNVSKDYYFFCKNSEYPVSVMAVPSPRKKSKYRVDLL